jgi:hypothetical protein
VLLQASPDHLVVIKGKGKNHILYKRAREVVVGDVMLRIGATDAQLLVEAVVVATHTTVNSGLFAPLTMGGTIIVNDVVASVHRYGRRALQLRLHLVTTHRGTKASSRSLGSTVQASLTPDRSSCRNCHANRVWATYTSSHLQATLRAQNLTAADRYAAVPAAALHHQPPYAVLGLLMLC